MPDTSKVLTPVEFTEAMKKIQKEGDGSHNDPETCLRVADALLMKLLESLGYKEGIAVFREIYKWYA